MGVLPLERKEWFQVRPPYCLACFLAFHRAVRCACAQARRAWMPGNGNATLFSPPTNTHPHTSPIPHKVARSLLAPAYWRGACTTHPGYSWYLSKVKAAVDGLRMETGHERVHLVGHSGGWVERWVDVGGWVEHVERACSPRPSLAPPPPPLSLTHTLPPPSWGLAGASLPGTAAVQGWVREWGGGWG